MTDADRRYLFIAKTFDAPGLTQVQFTELLSQAALPACLAADVSGPPAGVGADPP